MTRYGGADYGTFRSGILNLTPQGRRTLAFLILPQVILGGMFGLPSRLIQDAVNCLIIFLRALRAVPIPGRRRRVVVRRQDERIRRCPRSPVRAVSAAEGLRSKWKEVSLRAALRV